MKPVLLAFCAAAIAAGSLCFVYVWRFGKYRIIYRKLLTSNAIVMNTISTTQVMRDSYRKKIETDLSQTSHQADYRYFNELFMKRHSRMLTKVARKITFVLLVLFIAAAAASFYIPEVMTRINRLMLFFLPYSLILMYFINRGRSITAAMFVNCDQSMLTYRAYWQPHAILSLFTERLKYIAAINLLTASVIALELPLLLYVSGGTDNLINYLVLTVSVLAMAVFFSVHTLVLYYLLQPYNSKMKNKNPMYEIINTITYFVCYF